MIGQQIQQFKIVGKIGAGGMGEVFLAQDTQLDRKVALKFLPPQFGADEDLRARFLHEAKAAAALNHPNIVTVYDLGTYEGKPFIVMEYVEGQSLADLVAGGELRVDQAVRITQQIAEGLAAAHEAGIVHRDIKPGNIIIDKSGRAKILDFGLAKSRRATTDTQAGTTVGTAQYESPEQGRGAQVDQRSDLFSLGVVLYEMIAGQLPFRGEFTDAVRYAIAHENPDPLARYKADVPDELQRIVTKLLEKEPELRYQTASGVLSDLKSLERASDPRASTVQSALRPAVSKPRRLLAIVVPTTIVALAVVVLAVLRPWKIDIRSNQEATASENRLAVMYFDNLADPDDTQRLGEIAANLLITDLSDGAGIQVVSSQRLYDLLKQLGHEGLKRIDPSIATQVAEKAQARWMLLGSILKAEPNIVLTAQLVETQTGNAIGSQKITGADGEEIFALVDRLSTELRGDLPGVETVPAAKSSRSVADVTTHSTEAYREYLEGMELRSKFYTAEATPHFRRAVELDSTFAMAYLQLAVLSSGNPTERMTWLNLAKKYESRVTERERLWIGVAEALAMQKSAIAAEELREIIARYPDEKDAYIRLGQLCLQSQQFDSALLCVDGAMAIDPYDKRAFNLQAYAYNGRGEFEKSIESINRYLALAPDEANPYDSRADLYANNGHFAEAADSYREALKLKPDYYSSLRKLGDMYLLLHEYAKAESCFTVMSSSGAQGTRAEGRARLAAIPAYRGQLDMALGLLKDGLAADRLEGYRGLYLMLKQIAQVTFLMDQRAYDLAWSSALQAQKEFLQMSPNDPNGLRSVLAWIAAAAGRIDQSRAILDTLRSRIKDEDSTRMRDYWSAVAAVETEIDSFPAAATHLERALALGGNFSELSLRYALGRAYVEAGQPGEAIDQIRKVLTTYDEATMITPLKIARSHYYLGRAYEQSGWTKKAAEQYNLVLEIWKDADSTLTEREDAAQRLAALGA